MKFKTLLFTFFMVISVLNVTAQMATNNAQSYYDKFKLFFNDDICTELKQEYQALGDEELVIVLEEGMAPYELPEQFKEIALKVKNESWEKREKEFRITKAKPYSDPSDWKYYLNVRKYSNLQNPTGITGNGGSLLIFVGEELSEDLTLKCCFVSDNQAYYWNSRDLFSGLNMINLPKYDNSEESTMVFLEYNVKTDTTATSKKIADFPEIPIHIEGGYVNGYFDKNRHTDEDWRDMLANNFKHYSVQVLGDRVMYHMELENIKKACPQTITDAINWWDDCVAWQHELMGVEKYYDRWNDLMMAKDGYEDMFMYATEGYTYYEHYTLPDILPWAKVYESPGNMWGPAHEIGHMHQGAINIVTCTEVTNNLFANAHLFRAGKCTSRGKGLSTCIEDFTNKIPYPLRNDVFSKTRLYHQLYLYFHAAKKDVTFFPRLFDALRNDPLQKGDPDRNWTFHTYGVDNQLKFAEKCCEIAQMDLSEFFEAWGFFVPMDNVFVGDYENYIVNMTAEEAEASRKKMQQYEKKGGHLMFIEDRIKPSPRTDGVEGDRLDYETVTAVGKVGNTGQWSDYIDESVEAKGYYFYNRLGYIEIIKSEDAAGALGFKLLDANTGELLSFSNTYNISIPAHAYEREYKVVAAQANGTDVVLSDVLGNNDEELRKIILEKIIEDINTILKYTTKDGSDIGYYYTTAVAELKDLYNKAKEVIRNNDTSEHSYSEWYDILSQEFENVKNNPEARATMKPNEIYNIVNTVHFPYYLNDGEMGLQVVSGNGGQDAQKWVIEPKGEKNSFVIKNINGEYINDIEMNVGAMCSGKSKEEAIAFQATYTTNGDIYFETTEGEKVYLAVNGDGNVIGSTELVSSALWMVARIGKIETSIENIEADKRDNTIYDMLGRKIEMPRKGIYIVNGEKVMVK